jgi:hypothetical protein
MELDSWLYIISLLMLGLAVGEGIFRNDWILIIAGSVVAIINTIFYLSN